MKSKNATEWIANYIKEQGFSIEQISAELGIPKAKLQLGSSEELDIEEFLNICAHIGVTPERVREELGL